MMASHVPGPHARKGQTGACQRPETLEWPTSTRPCSTQLEVGLDMKGVTEATRLKALPPGGMCQFKVRLGTLAEVDAELLGWIRTAFDQAG